MCTVINRHRILEGKLPLTPESGETTAMVWIDALDMHGIPANAYDPLYKRISEGRVADIRRGEDPKPFTAELMVSHWHGPNGLKKAREEYAQKQLHGAPCGLCHGTGWRRDETTDERYPGVRRCSH